MMKMDVNAIIEKMETGEQDTILTALQSFNKEVNISSAACKEIGRLLYTFMFWSYGLFCWCRIASVPALGQLQTPFQDDDDDDDDACIVLFKGKPSHSAVIALPCSVWHNN